MILTKIDSVPTFLYVSAGTKYGGMGKRCLCGAVLLAQAAPQYLDYLQPPRLVYKPTHTHSFIHLIYNSKPSKIDSPHDAVVTLQLVVSFLAATSASPQVLTTTSISASTTESTSTISS